MMYSMRSTLRVARLMFMAAFAVPLGAAAQTQSAAPTFTKDVAPILYKNCVECHRPDAMAPMSLITYDDARPWARAVKQKVVKREMPPWGADPAIGKFSNDVSLNQTEIDTIAAWVDAGAPQGNPADLPPAPRFESGWSIGTPDLIFRMQQPITVPADGTVPDTPAGIVIWMGRSVSLTMRNSCLTASQMTVVACGPNRSPA